MHTSLINPFYAARPSFTVHNGETVEPMSSPNPYESPRTQSRLNASPGRQRRPYLAWMILPALIGAIIGFLVGPMFARGPGDPTGHFVGTAVVGAVGLGVGFVIRLLVSLFGDG